MADRVDIKNKPQFLNGKKRIRFK